MFSSDLFFSPLPNFDLHAAAAVAMADIPGVGNTDEKQLPSLKEIYVGFSDMVSIGAASKENFSSRHNHVQNSNHS